MKKLILFLLVILTGFISFAEEEKKTETLVKIPIIFSSPDTGFGAGLMAVGYNENKDFDKPNSYNLGTILTQEGQFLLFGSFDSFLKQGKYKRELGFGLNSWPSQYYGLGQNSLFENEDEYDSTSGKLNYALSKRISKNIVIGPMATYLFSDIDKLSSKNISKNYNLENGKDQIAGLGIKLDYDSRDRIFDPNTGLKIETSMIYNKFLDENKDFSVFAFDLKNYRQLFNNTLAFQANLINESGDVPFYSLAGYGGSNIMRGYNEGRYLDKNSFASQVEYRFRISKKFKATVFAGAGEVFPEIGDFEFNDLKKSYGLGLRYIIDEEAGINFRLDLAFNEQDGDEDSVGFYFSVMEAF